MNTSTTIYTDEYVRAVFVTVIQLSLACLVAGLIGTTVYRLADRCGNGPRKGRWRGELRL